MTATTKPTDLVKAIQIVLGLASGELCSLYEVARRDDNKEVEAQADAAAKSLERVEPLLKAAPQVLEALELCWIQLSTWVADVDSDDTSPEDEEALSKAVVALAKAA